MASQPSCERPLCCEPGNRCEYCHLSQAGQEAAFHIDHVTPRASGGPTVLQNLALACVSCSLRKGARRSMVDVESGEEIALFNPRTQAWAEHLLRRVTTQKSFFSANLFGGTKNSSLT